MNCINHPESPVAAYCQNCGKPLCAQCVRQVSGIVYCESCLAAKLGTPPPGAAAGTYNVNVGDSRQFQYSASGPLPPGMPGGPSPALATLLGFIPGVGAMYNGQFAKALIHVLVFVVLVSITDEHTIFLIFVFAWVFYQVFDAHHTAIAKREGLPLPDPFGLNELGVRMGFQQARPQPSASVPPGAFTPGFGGDPGYPPPYTASAPFAAAAPFTAAAPPAGFAGQPSSEPQGPAPFPNPYPPPVAPGPYGPQEGVPGGPPFPPPSVSPSVPVGAVVLIGLGLLFLLHTVGVLNMDWIGHGWPLILIVLGVWIFVKRSRELPPGGGL